MERVVMGVECGVDYKYWNPIKETLAEGETVSDAIRECDRLFNLWLERRITGELGGRPYASKDVFLKTHRFQVMKAAPWEVKQ